MLSEFDACRKCASKNINRTEEKVVQSFDGERMQAWVVKCRDCGNEQLENFQTP